MGLTAEEKRERRNEGTRVQSERDVNAEAEDILKL